MGGWLGAPLVWVQKLGAYGPGRARAAVSSCGGLPRRAGQGPPGDGSADLGGVLAARLRDPWARPAVLPCPSQRGSWLAWRPWPQEETRPPSWQTRLLGTSSRTREWKTASLKLRLFFLAIPEVDAAREVVWPRTRGCGGSQIRARQSQLPPGQRESLRPPQASPGAGRPSELTQCLSWHPCPSWVCGRRSWGDTPGGFSSSRLPSSCLSLPVTTHGDLCCGGGPGPCNPLLLFLCEATAPRLLPFAVRESGVPFSPPGCPRHPTPCSRKRPIGQQPPGPGIPGGLLALGSREICWVWVPGLCWVWGWTHRHQALCVECCWVWLSPVSAG